MASSPIGSPSTLGITPDRKVVPRSSTAPTRIGSSNNSSPAGDANNAETLFVTSNVKIFSFTAPQSHHASNDMQNSGKGRVEGTMPWGSPTERTAAIGTLELYRIVGAVTFLRCGNLLQPIMRTNQCWCLDGISKFALRVGRENVYRIELPGDTPEDREHAEGLKNVFAQVLSYERTTCPFARTFSVDLPVEEPKPRRKSRKSTGPAKKWIRRASSWKKEGEEEEEEEEPERRGSQDLSDLDEDDDDDYEEGEEYEDDDQDAFAEQAGDSLPNTPSKPSRLAADRFITASPQVSVRSTPPSRIRIPGFLSGSSETALEKTSSIPNPLDPSRLQNFQAIPTDMPPSPPDSSAGLETAESSTRIESFAPLRPAGDTACALSEDARDITPTDQGTDVHLEHETETQIPSALEPVLETAVERKSSEDVVPAHSSEVQASLLPSALEPHTTIKSNITETAAPNVAPVEEVWAPRQLSDEERFAQIQARILARRTIGSNTTAFQLRPRPSIASISDASASSARSKTLLRSRSQAQLMQQQAMSTALAQKACAVFLGPPAYLVEIMVRIARQIRDGAIDLSTRAFRLPRERHRRIPGSFYVDPGHDDDGAEWMVSDEEVEEQKEDEDQDEDDELEEDDFGVPLRSPIRIARVNAVSTGRTDKERKGSTAEARDAILEEASSD